MRFSANPFIAKPLIAACVVSLAAFSQVSANEPVVVSSKIDTEGSVLGELIIQTLERHDIATENRLQLGGTSVVRAALEAGKLIFTRNTPVMARSFRYDRQLCME
ncbi:hypothetical protein HORIV_33710 [Vreelandella olivaria]|uniref:ABC-type glycine betaine transport system substrate-binding domain-containing protein n=1 Tax=Vreelandella olivaria TaxID=390919 RepID=A0ABN5WVS5_9GAMM|nr:hypothetical protein HORIV_33710 [Halomonas olivaria]